METEEKWGLVKMSSTFAIDINVRFYDFLQKKHFSPAYQQLCLDVFMVGTQGKLLTFRFYIFPTLIYISYFILDVQEKGKVSLQID